MVLELQKFSFHIGDAVMEEAESLNFHNLLCSKHCLAESTEMKDILTKSC